MHRTLISFMESGKRLPRLDSLLKLAGALDKNPSVLLEGMSYQPAELFRGTLPWPDSLKCERRAGP